MTITELNGVRFLMSELKEAQAELERLRRTSASIVPVLNDLPHGSTVRSKVEELTLKIVKQEKRIESYQAALKLAKMGLTEWILTRRVQIPAQRVTLLLYAEGLTVREVSVKTGFTRRHVSRLAAEFLKKCHLDSTQN